MFVLLLSKCLSNILQQQHQRNRIDGRRFELEVLVELPGRLIDRMNQHGPDPYDIRGFFDSSECVDEERFSKSFTLLALVDC